MRKMNKPTESEIMNLTRKNHGCFNDSRFQTITIKKKRYNMKAVREVLEQLKIKGKLKKKIIGSKSMKIITYYIPSMRKEAEEYYPGYFHW